MEDRLFGRRYRVTERLGSGGMAEVYKAVDEVLGRTVAVKVLHPRYASEADFVARFRQEAQAAANLSHPSIVNIYDWGKDDHTYYIVMEYVRGTDLKTLLDEHGPLDPVKVAHYGQQICSALAVAHGYDVIHRDIKPANIVLMPDGNVKVMDFGIARAGDSTMTQTGSVLGTAQYISPEQAQGRPLGPASDLYSLGVTLYELTTGKLPFTGDTPVAVALKQVNEVPVPPRRIRPEIPASLEAVILKAMQKDPAERYRSADEMRADLRRVASGEPVSAVAPSPQMLETAVIPALERDEYEAAPRTRRRRRITPWVWLAVVATLLALGVAIAAALGLFGARTVPVPDVRNLSEAQATRAINEAGLKVGDKTSENNDSVETGHVISQDPPGRVPVPVGTEIDLVLSLGIAQAQVPELDGLTQDAALQAIRDAGLTLESIRQEASDEVEAGRITRSDPSAGTQVSKGSGVTIFVSTGPEQVEVPDVRGKSIEQARQLIEAQGLKTVVTRERFSAEVEKGFVLAQTPAPGSKVEPGKTISVEVSKGEEKIKVPDVTGLSEAEATAKLQALGLKVRVTYQESPDPADIGVVLTQSPAQDAEVSKGTTVEITVGQSPEEPPAPQP